MFKVLAFDPGLSTAGWALLEVTTPPLTFNVAKCGMIYPNRDVNHKEYREDLAKYGARILTFGFLKEMVAEIMNDCQPDYVVSESAFLQRGRVNAYEALSNWITVVGLFIRENYSKQLNKVSPTEAKMAISGNRVASKEDVQAAVRRHTDIKLPPPPGEDYTEHTYDAIAIGYAFVQLNKGKLL